MRWYLVGFAALLALAGCGRSYFQFGERELWRREAEIACLNSGTVREGGGVVRIEPIEGPGMCGADFPLKVSMLGETSALGYGDEEVVRPPGSIPGARAASGPRWPISQSPLPPPVSAQRVEPLPSPAGEPMSIHAPGAGPSSPQPQYQQLGAPPAYLRAPPTWQRVSPAPAASYEPRTVAPIGAPQDEPEELPPYARPEAAPSVPVQPMRPLPRLGPSPPPVIAASSPVEVHPTATLACPIVSALDRWIANAVQPAAQKWFGQPVVEIKQISAYSCRGMNGNPNAHISEHAFGNALDIAAFVLADGHRITVKAGWHGSPEEQGFLRDIQGAACDQFTTVLAPGSNRFHYDHIHVDLMRRSSGRRICQPGAVDGELVASRARGKPAYAARQPEPPPSRRYDPPFRASEDPFAWRGDARRGDPATTGSIAAVRPGVNPAADDNDWIEDPGPRPPIDWSNDRHKVR